MKIFESKNHRYKVGKEADKINLNFGLISI